MLLPFATGKAECHTRMHIVFATRITQMMRSVFKVREPYALEKQSVNYLA